MLVRLQFIADVLALDISLCQAIASQLAGLTLHGIVHLCSQNEHLLAVFFFFFFWGTGELSTLRQMMKVPNEPGLSPNNGLENAFLSVSVHGKQSPQGASNTYWRQDDQP